MDWITVHFRLRKSQTALLKKYLQKLTCLASMAGNMPR
jgi:hypothetical protein